MLNLRLLILVLGLFLSKLALFLLVPMTVGLITLDGTVFDFFTAAMITGAVGGAMITFGKLAPSRPNSMLRARDMFMLTSMVWLIFSSMAALPFVFIEHISFTDAFFETISGVTTTGSTVLSDLPNHAPSILIWRSILQWLGGIGFIVMGVGILPYLNVGGMKLFQTESSDWSDKQVPRLKHYTALLFTAYSILTALCMVCYKLSGMSWFDAINHALTTLSTGGYSTSDASMAGFPVAAHWVAIVFMFAGGIPLLLFIQSARRKSLNPWQDQQLMGYLKLVLLASAVLTAYLYMTHQQSLIDAARLSLFNVISIVTTTGFALTDYSAWGALAAGLFFLLTFAGGCSGSTAGGIKIFRFQVAWEIMLRHLRSQVHPYGTFTARYNKRPISDDIVASVLTLAFLFMLTMALLTLFLAALGLDFVTALTGAVTAVCNVGPGLGDTIGPAGNFSSLPDAAKWALGIGMLAGRLEITTLVILFLPKFWKK
ncbi:TrkH family potassium uptake protein [Echinimonas agarilytica]|uniref:Trk system potassium uptake protein n=1 Tax=Echinimonas agarilytica TaxID=1215918 RepID=A0AA42B5P6_9GAMM|nr:TrkH family potassium uptake protein [Echinimonas agarilytica]MCM2678067.1 TrkH family potassium uptake protein [Echinimonas agarilytica]